MPVSEEFADVIDELLKGAAPKDRRGEAILSEIEQILENMRDYFQVSNELALAEARSKAAFDLFTSTRSEFERRAAEEEHKRAARQGQELEAKASELRKKYGQETTRLRLLSRILDVLGEAS